MSDVKQTKIIENLPNQLGEIDKRLKELTRIIQTRSDNFRSNYYSKGSYDAISHLMQIQHTHIRHGLKKGLDSLLYGRPMQIEPIGHSIVKVFEKMLVGYLSRGRAGGGYVAAHEPYIVGEKGPEVFIPNRGGYVSNRPNAFSPQVVMNISTPDAHSFRKNTSQIMMDMMQAINRAKRHL